MTKPGPRATGVLLLLGAAALWSVSGVAVKVAEADPIVFAMLRSLGAGLVLLPMIAVGGRMTGSTRPAARLMIPAAIAHTVMVGALIVAMTRATAAEGILLQYTGPAWCALYAWLLLGRRIDRPTLVALAIAAAGVAIMLLGVEREPEDLRWLGPAMGVAAGAGWGAVIIYLDLIDRDAVARTGVPSNIVLVVVINNLASAAILLPWAIGRGLLGVSPGVAMFVLLVGVVQMAVPYVLFQLGIRRVGPVAAGLLVLGEPLLNPVWVWLATGERPPGAAFAGGAMILLAVVVTILFARRRPTVPEEA